MCHYWGFYRGLSGCYLGLVNYIAALTFTRNILKFWILKYCSQKTRPSKSKVFYESLTPSPTALDSITKKPKRTFCEAKVIEGLEPPKVSNDRVLFRVLRNGVLFRVLSDKFLLRIIRDNVLFRAVTNRDLYRVLSDWVFFRVLSGRVPFSVSLFYFVLLYITFSKRGSRLATSLTCVNNLNKTDSEKHTVCMKK